MGDLDGFISSVLDRSSCLTGWAALSDYLRDHGRPRAASAALWMGQTDTLPIRFGLFPTETGGWEAWPEDRPARHLFAGWGWVGEPAGKHGHRPQLPWAVFRLLPEADDRGFAVYAGPRRRAVVGLLDAADRAGWRPAVHRGGPR